MSGHEQPREGLSRNWVAAGITLAGLLAAVYLYSKSENEQTGEPTHISDSQKAERARKKAEWNEMCDALAGKRDDLKKRYFNRRGILEGLHKLGSCTDPQGTEFNFPDVCRSIADGIRKTGPRMNPVLNPFYTMLYSELQCEVKMHASDKDRESAIKDLLSALESTEGIQKYRLLDYNRKLDSKLCEEARLFANEGMHQKSFNTILNYVIEKGMTPAIDANSPLGEIIGRAKKNFETKNNRPPQNASDLSEYAASRLKLLIAAVKFPFLCTMNPMTVIQSYDSSLTEDVLTEKRRLALPVVRQLMDLLKAETDEEKARRVTGAILTLARDMTNEGKR